MGGEGRGFDIVGPGFIVDQRVWVLRLVGRVCGTQVKEWSRSRVGIRRGWTARSHRECEE